MSSTNKTNYSYTKKEIDSMGGGSSLSDAISQKANDSDVVHKNGNETISGTKTFSSVIKGSIDGNAGTASSVQWNNVQGKPNLMPREDAGYKGISGNGSYLWCKFATITTGFSYINYPICFEVSCRGGIKSTLQVRFLSTDNLDPALDRFITDNDTNFYIKKTAPRTWELYCMYNGTSAWGSFSLYRVTNMYNLPIDKTLVNLETEPTGITQCTLHSEGIEEQGDGYIRYSSGIQICWGAINVNTNEETDISFSKPFIDTKYCIISTASSWGRYSNSYPKGPGVFGMYANFTSSGKCDVYWQAIGKWK